MRVAGVRMACMLGLMLAAGRAEAQNRFWIDRVEAVSVQDGSGGSVGLASARLPKFMEGYETTPREVYQVSWHPPVAGVRAGTLVTFEYRQQHSERIKFLSIKYPFPVKEERKAVFEISPAVTRELGRVTAWRARVVWGGRLLAEQISDNWTD